MFYISSLKEILPNLFECSEHVFANVITALNLPEYP